VAILDRLGSEDAERGHVDRDVRRDREPERLDPDGDRLPGRGAEAGDHGRRDEPVIGDHRCEHAAAVVAVLLRHRESERGDPVPLLEGVEPVDSAGRSRPSSNSRHARRTK
jgi:hypothetical protein